MLWKPFLVNLELPYKLFVCLDVFGKLRSFREIKVACASHSKLLATPMNPVESGSMAGLNSDDYFVSFQLLPRIS